MLAAIDFAEELEMIWDDEAERRRAAVREAFRDVGRRLPPPLGAGEEVSLPAPPPSMAAGMRSSSGRTHGEPLRTTFAPRRWWRLRVRVHPLMEHEDGLVHSIAVGGRE
jgi:hypothetical protein